MSRAHSSVGHPTPAYDKNSPQAVAFETWLADVYMMRDCPHFLTDKQWADTWEYTWGVQNGTYVKGRKSQPGTFKWRSNVHAAKFHASLAMSDDGKEEVKLLTRVFKGTVLEVVPASKIGKIIHTKHVLESGHLPHNATYHAVSGTRACPLPYA